MVFQQPSKPEPIPTTAQRLEDMKKRWDDANSRQKTTIDRLASSREKALQMLADAPDHQINPALRQRIVEALNS
jgi:hypothetical protein